MVVSRLGGLAAGVRAMAVVAMLTLAIAPSFADAGQGYRGQNGGQNNDQNNGHDNGRGRDGRYDGRRDSRGYVYDGRYGHNHYYPPRGYAVGALPRGYVTVNYRGGPYYYHQGIWYRPGGGRYLVVRPAIGLYVGALPPFYTTVWFGGSPYYYADDVYYSWRPDRRQYVVVDAPSGAQASTSAPAGQSSDLFIYPKNGQNEEQQGRDKYECHSWAANQSGFNPTEPAGGVDDNQIAGKRADYQRAMGACLEARGYSVK